MNTNQLVEASLYWLGYITAVLLLVAVILKLAWWVFRQAVGWTKLSAELRALRIHRDNLRLAANVTAALNPGDETIFYHASHALVATGANYCRLCGEFSKQALAKPCGKGAVQ